MFILTDLFHLLSYLFLLLCSLSKCSGHIWLVFIYCFLKNFIRNWSLIVLQCAGFCCIIASHNWKECICQCYFLICSTSIWCLFFWLISLCAVVSSFIHLIRTDSNLLLFVAEWCSVVCMYHIFFILSSVDAYLACFPVLTVVNSAAMNIVGICVFLNCGFLRLYAQ